MHNKLLCFVCILAAGLPLYGGQEGAPSLTLDQCLSQAFSSHPLILSASDLLRAAQAREAQARALPWPLFEYDSDLQPGFFDFRNSDESYAGLSQTIEFPGKRHLRGRIARQESLLVQSDIDLLRIDLVYQVTEAFFGLLLAQEKLTYAGQDLDLARDYLRITELKFSAGDVARMEILRAQVESAKVASALRTAENEMALARARLNFWLARKRSDPLTARGQLKRSSPFLDAETLKEQALVSRPEMRRVEQALHRESLKKKLSFLSYMPDLELGVSRHRLRGEATTWDIALSFAIPLFFWQPIRGEIAEAQATTDALLKESEHVRNTIFLEVEEAHCNAMTTQSQIRLFEDEILSQSEEAYGMFLLSYREGEIGGIELIEARRTLIEARKTYADALFNNAVAMAALEKAVGKRLGGKDNEFN